MAVTPRQISRRSALLTGLVQGVGLRPFVHGLATRLGLGGFVRNEAGQVRIEVEGEASALDRFCIDLSAGLPPLAEIRELLWCDCEPQNERTFRIEASVSSVASAVQISPDVAPCAACLTELFDPRDRRYRYPFLNCTNCGPRLTVICGVPYDRAQTTLAAFELCAKCRTEYADPSSRRFHAEPTACPACGPQLSLWSADGIEIVTDNPLEQAEAWLRAGQIGAIKGLGGYHLACDAANELAVAALRRRKQRNEKPFALMVTDLDAARRLCDVSSEEEQLLASPRRPIVLLRRRRDDRRLIVAEAVAPGSPYLGIMLPYTPLHHLLLHDLDGLPLVMTSGNRSDEPIAYDDVDAFDRLGTIADFFLTHDRPIHIRCDDAVTRLVAGEELPLRRSRGSAPETLRLPVECPFPILAVGGQWKNTFALGRGDDAVLSHHLGDLDELSAFRAFEAAIEHYERLFAIRPQMIVHDLHPDYASTRYALERAAKDNLPYLSVQHHHAHIASGMVDNGLNEPVIGVAFDGTGFGADGAIWGGEFFIGDYRQVRRAAHLRYIPMPGSDRAVLEPWRMAKSQLVDSGEDDDLLRPFVAASSLRVLERMLEADVNSPHTSSAGRLFDAVASLVGLRQHVSYEGQAAMELEWAAMDEPASGAYPFEFVEAGRDTECRVLVDTRPLICAIVRDVRHRIPVSRISRRFHSTVVEIIVEVCRQLRQTYGLNAVVLSGGVFTNAIVLTETISRLSSDGFRAYRHRQVPSNDGGLCLGQLSIAATLSRLGTTGG